MRLSATPWGRWERIVAGLLLVTMWVVVVLRLVGPIETDDLWWHLSLGDLFASRGLDLPTDPRLHPATAKAPTNAWLWDLGMAALARAAGLASLKLAHGVFVAAILALVFTALRRMHRSASALAFGLAAFVALADYRLVQLRPELASLALTATLLAFVFDSGQSRATRGAVVALTCAVWPHLHPGFPLGPALVTGWALANGLAGWRDSADDRRTFGEPVMLASLALVATGLSLALHPLGLTALSIASNATLDQSARALVVDEWRGFRPLLLPRSNLPPSPAAWFAWWAVALTFTLDVVGGARLAGWRGLSRRAPEIALGLVGLLAPLVAVRFLWLGLLPIWSGTQIRGHDSRASPTWVPGLRLALTLALVLSLAGASAWRPARAIRGSSWKETVDADRYYGHAVRFLAETGVSGRLFHPYFMGGYVEYWLGPRLEAFVDGSLNVPETALRDYAAILQERPELAEARDTTEVLDRHQVDWVIGIGLPQPPPPGRPWRYSTRILEDDPRWILAYRGLRSAVYLRRTPRSAGQLDRLERYFADRGVPFDREAGFAAQEVLADAPQWAIEHGVAPRDYPELERAARSAPGARGRIARNRLAWTLGVLGRYEAAWALDGFEERNPGRPEAWRRALWLAMARDDRERLREWSALGTPRLPEPVRAWIDEPDATRRARSARRFLPLDRAGAGRLKSVESNASLPRRQDPVVRGARDD